MSALTLADLRRYAVARSLFPPTTLPKAIARLGFVQADPICAPARAQDLMLRHRVERYRAGDLERRYRRLAVEEDTFVNYGFLPRATLGLMHPRTPRTRWSAARQRQVQDVLAFVRAHAPVHPRHVDAHFEHGTSRNWFGGASNVTTQLLEGMHYRGLLRVAWREGGTRVYAAREPWPDVSERLPVPERLDRLVDIIVHTYAPIPSASLGKLIGLLRWAVPQWSAGRREALVRAKARLARERIDGVEYYWPAGEAELPRRARQTTDTVRLLTPFDPVVWDRTRFELFWGWAYRFEAYLPAAKRQRGYYALPLLWRDLVIGWGNLRWRQDQLDAQIGYVSGSAPRDAAYRGALEQELARMRSFLGGEPRS